MQVNLLCLDLNSCDYLLQSLHHRISYLTKLSDHHVKLLMMQSVFLECQKLELQDICVLAQG